MVISRGKVVCSVFFLVVCRLTLAQTAQPTILTIDLENFVQYLADTSDISQYGVNAGVTPPAAVGLARIYCGHRLGRYRCCQRPARERPVRYAITGNQDGSKSQTGRSNR